MSDHHTYKKVELVGSSRTASKKQSTTRCRSQQSIKHLEWFEVTETLGHIKMARLRTFSDPESLVPIASS